MSEKSVLDVIVVGAGVAGLAAAYGLRKDDVQHRYRVRILERRTEVQCGEAGFPIHLSPPGRKALESLLTPSDFAALQAARKSLPTRHDGIHVLNSSGKLIWHTIREPGESCLVERGDVCEILRGGVEGIEFDKNVKWVRNLHDGVAVGLESGEVMHADVVIAADGMFSPIRRFLHPEDGFEPWRYTTINIRTSAAMERFCPDPYGINVQYGKNWSAAMIPLPEGLYVAITVPSPVSSPRQALEAIEPVHFVDALYHDSGLKSARAFPLHSATMTKPGRGRIVLIGDSAHGMVPFCGAGASAGMRDGYELVKALNEATDIDKAIASYNLDLVKRNDSIIVASKRVLWLAQGGKAWHRLVRGTAFRAIEVFERMTPMRARKEKELARKVDEERSKARMVTFADEPEE